MSEINVPESFSEEEINDIQCVDTFDYDSVTENHWLFERASVLNSLLLLGLVIHDGADLTSTLCRVKRVATGVELTVNSGDIAVRTTIPILNPEHILDKCFLVNFSVFATLIKNAGPKFLIKESEGAPVMSLQGGTAELETFNIENEPEVYDLAVFNDTEGFSSFPSSDFYGLLQRCSASMALAQTPESRKVRIEQDGTAYSNFIASVFMTSGSPVTGVSLRAIDVQVLLRLMTEGANFQFKEVPAGYLFESQASKVLLRKWKTDEAKGIAEFFLPADTPRFSISPSYAIKILSIMREVLGAMGVLRWESRGGKLLVSARTRQGKLLSFPLASIPQDFTFNILCPVNVVWGMLTLFRNEGALDILVAGSRMQFVSEKITVLFGSNI